jgi:cyclic pyranopterin phosphate synthase
MGGKPRLNHFNQAGQAHMVGVSRKAETTRVAVATGRVWLADDTAAVIESGTAGKGDVLGVARLAGIQATKRTADLIPLCHPLRITGVELELSVHRKPGKSRVDIVASVRARDRTGVEMEALTAVSVAALTVYDMCKAMDRGMRIGRIQLESKSGGRSGAWKRQ